MPALPLDEAGKYVAAAYLVFLALILAYVGIMAAKLQRIERDLSELADLAEGKADRTRNAEGKAVRTRDEVPVPALGPAAPLAPEPADTAAGGEDVGGGVPS
jgi:hypothetical protein